MRSFRFLVVRSFLVYICFGILSLSSIQRIVILFFVVITARTSIFSLSTMLATVHACVCVSFEFPNAPTKCVNEHHGIAVAGVRTYNSHWQHSKKMCYCVLSNRKEQEKKKSENVVSRSDIVWNVGKKRKVNFCCVNFDYFYYWIFISLSLSFLNSVKHTTTQRTK